MRALRVLHQHGESVRVRVKDEIADVLGAERSTAALIGAAVRAHAAIDAEGERALARSHGLAPACAAGCSYCCHVTVDATAPEILAVAAHLADRMPSEALGALRDRLRRRAAEIAPLTDEERWDRRIPCALLDQGGRCSIYEVRPLRCRAFHSCSVAPCREAFAGRSDAEPLLSPALERAHDAVEDGYDQALLDAGLSPAAHRLETGLLAALDGRPL